MQRRLLSFAAFLVFIFSSVCALAGGLRGMVRSDDGSPLAFASIYVKQLGTGTTTNQDGLYEMTLPSGSYEIVFQFLGFESQVHQVTIGDTFTELNVTLKTQVLVLQNVTVRAGKEDPAYTIMRKAIAKAKYHTQQVDTYSARVYVKGAGQLKDYPWMAKKALEKEGIEKDRVFISESVSEIKYKRPNTFEERVISIRSDGKDNNTSPTNFIFGSFYQPTIAETVSPLSPAAFSYYRFEFLGTFKDRNYEVSRIKVTPRSKGDNVVEGTIYIVEDWWSIHSLDVTTTKLGITIEIRQIYAPIEDKAWLPVSQNFLVGGKFFGFEFEYKYLATVSDYKITLNPDLVVPDMEVIDDKVAKDQAKAIEEKYGKKNQQLQQRLASGKEITRKELRTMVKEYEKQEQKEQKEPDVVSNTSFKIDSGAYKKDSAYWALIRPVPLTEAEQKGYRTTDSLAVIERKKEEGDTLKRGKNSKAGFQPWDLLLGDFYKVSKHSNFAIEMPQSYFNTVEGFNLIYRLNFGSVLQDTNKTRLNIIPTFRYAFAREKLSGNLRFRLRNKNYRFEVEGGRYVKQFNPNEPILPIINTVSTLFFEKNWMKIYERDYVDIRYRKALNRKYVVSTEWSWATRRELFNTSDYNIVDRSFIEGYTPNAPVNAELANTSFREHQAFIGSVNVSARPWLKYRIRNGFKSEIENSSPTLMFEYRKGFNNILGSDINFDQVETGIKHTFRIGVRGLVFASLRAGAFLNKDSLAFMDYNHFQGNRTALMTTDPAGSFRLLDYYALSTRDKYFAGNVYYQFRRFLFTSIPYARMLGVRESIFANYLATPASKNYTEVGYAVEGILRLFRVEIAAAFADGQYQTYGVRVGIATNLTVRFSDN
jgi:hypothetical protein